MLVLFVLKTFVEGVKFQFLLMTVLSDKDLSNFEGDSNYVSFNFIGYVFTFNEF
jgi:hypothetical protein